MDWTAHAKKRLEDFSNGDETALPNVYSCFAGHDKDLIYAAVSALAAEIEDGSPFQLMAVQHCRFCFCGLMMGYSRYAYSHWHGQTIFCGIASWKKSFLGCPIYID